jgi:hypothetical protein
MKGIGMKMLFRIPKDIRRSCHLQSRMQMVRCAYLARKSQGKWNETIGDKRKIYNLNINLRFLTNTTTRTPLTHIKDKQHTTHPYPTETYSAFFYLSRNYACTYYSSSQPKTTAEYLRTYIISFGGIIHTSLPNN